MDIKGQDETTYLPTIQYKYHGMHNRTIMPPVHDKMQTGCMAAPLVANKSKKIQWGINQGISFKSL